MFDSESPRGFRLKRRPHTTKGTIVFAILTVITFAWRVFDVWSNLEFIGQKAGLFWKIVYFLIATQAGANTLVVLFVALLVTSLLFQSERRPALPPADDPPRPALTSPSVAAVPPLPQPEEKPNLVFKKPDHLYVYSQFGAVLQEGRDTSPHHFDPDYVGVVVPVENEFSDQFKVIPVSGITAQLFYDCGTEELLTVNRGAWLDIGNRTGFRVNDVRRVIVAVVIPSRSNDPLVVAICKEYEQDFNHLENLVRVLDKDYYRVRVKLISEESGLIYGDREFDLDITRDPLIVELTPLVESSAVEIRQKLESFLDASNELLKRFPKDSERTDEDVKQVDILEQHIVRFLRRHPNRFSVAAFLTDVPVVKYAGVAHSSNWPTLNRLTTRIARLKDMVDEMRTA